MFTLSIVALSLGMALGMDTQRPLPAWSQPAGPNCQTPPEGSSEEVVKCFDNACDVYRAEWNACSTPACKTQATAKYIAAINACDPHVRIGSSGWASFWYAPDGYGVAFDDDEIPALSFTIQF